MSRKVSVCGVDTMRSIHEQGRNEHETKISLSVRFMQAEKRRMMSTMYYTHTEKKAIGQTHFKGKGQGYHFTWCMFPMQFADITLRAAILKGNQVVDEYGNQMSLPEFQEIVKKATSQSFDEGIE